MRIGQPGTEIPKETRANLMEDLSILAVIGEGMKLGVVYIHCGESRWRKSYLIVRAHG